jgi:hypothetical protein
MSRGNQMKIKMFCKKCGKEFSCYSWQKQRKYCSRDCIEFKFAHKGKLHPAYKNGSGKYDYRQRLKTIEVRGNSCEICGKTKNINVHHIDMNPKNNNKNNLQVLCCSCHRKIHSKYFGMTEIEKKQAQRKRINKSVRERNKRIMDNRYKEALAKYPDYCEPKTARTMLCISRERLRQLSDMGTIGTIHPYGKSHKWYSLTDIKKRLDI